VLRSKTINYAWIVTQSNSIFFETHQENIDLRIDLNNFIDNYQTNETIEEDEIYQFDGEDYDDYDEESIPEHLDDIDLLTNAHVEELKVIYYNKSLEEEADKCSLNESQKNDYLSHLNNITCCTDSCL